MKGKHNLDSSIHLGRDELPTRLIGRLSHIQLIQRVKELQLQLHNQSESSRVEGRHINPNRREGRKISPVIRPVIIALLHSEYLVTEKIFL